MLHRLDALKIPCYSGMASYANGKWKLHLSDALKTRCYHVLDGVRADGERLHLHDALKTRCYSKRALFARSVCSCICSMR